MAWHGLVIDDIEEHNSRLLSLSHVETAALPFAPIPSADSEVKISVWRAGRLWIPYGMILLGKEGTLEGSCYSFLIENEALGKKAVFDLGIRKDAKHESEMYKSMAVMLSAIAPHDSAEVLVNAGLELASIDDLIISHLHYDHTGDIRVFAPNTRLVLGPKTPERARMLEELDITGEELDSRPVRILTHEDDTWVDLGPCKGHDLWGDGSLYVLDLPGHKAGHIGLLVRTCARTQTYFLLGGDAAHHCCLFHDYPTAGQRFKIGVFPLQGGKGELISMHEDLEEAYRSLAKVERFEEEANVLVLTAHDMSLEEKLFETKNEHEFVKLAGSKEQVAELKARAMKL